MQARFARADVTFHGEARAYTRVADSGTGVTFHFCGSCGSTVWWELGALPGFVAVAVGAFADPAFPGPTVSIYEARSHSWSTIGGVEHLD